MNKIMMNNEMMEFDKIQYRARYFYANAKKPVTESYEPNVSLGQAMQFALDEVFGMDTSTKKVSKIHIEIEGVKSGLGYVMIREIIVKRNKKGNIVTEMIQH